MKAHTLFIWIVLMGCGASQEKAAPPTELYSYDVEERIKELGIDLTGPALPPNLKLVLAKRSGNLVYLSGNGPLPAGDRKGYYGKVGKDLTVEEGYAAARSTAISQLKALQDEIGDLNKVVGIVKVFGMVNCEPTFTEQPQVINGFSELMIEVFGERGKHARSAVGMTSLPWNIACEVEMIVEVRE